MHEVNSPRNHLGPGIAVDVGGSSNSLEPPLKLIQVGKWASKTESVALAAPVMLEDRRTIRGSGTDIQHEDEYPDSLRFRTSPETHHSWGIPLPRQHLLGREATGPDTPTQYYRFQ